MPVKRHDGFWYRVPVADLKVALGEIEERYGDQAVLDTNERYNLAILTPPGEMPDRSSSPKGIGLYYVGYIDMTSGEVIWGEDPANEPHFGQLIVVGEAGHA